MEKRYLCSYEENEKITEEIEAVMKEKSSGSKKIKKLRSLSSNVQTNFSKCHISYYLKKLTESRRNRFMHIICAAVVLMYFIFTMFRIYWYLN